MQQYNWFTEYSDETKLKVIPFLSKSDIRELHALYQARQF